MDKRHMEVLLRVFKSEKGELAMITRRGLAVTLAVAVIGGSLLSFGSRPAAAQNAQVLCLAIIQSQTPALLGYVQMGMPPCTVLEAAIVAQSGAALGTPILRPTPPFVGTLDPRVYEIGPSCSDLNWSRVLGGNEKIPCP